ncbi:hypothetical protein BJ741DRAFT_586237 [Chytriomyces cf. hyalinus JEL632]|nr:hypothetical protein BJ741DRAFT_586237 [Chytriomyces cf. hyalinus JEL632]
MQIVRLLLVASASVVVLAAPAVVRRADETTTVDDVEIPSPETTTADLPTVSDDAEVSPVVDAETTTDIQAPIDPTESIIEEAPSAESSAEEVAPTGLPVSSAVSAVTSAPAAAATTSAAAVVTTSASAKIAPTSSAAASSAATVAAAAATPTSIKSGANTLVLSLASVFAAFLIV